MFTLHWLDLRGLDTESAAPAFLPSQSSAGSLTNCEISTWVRADYNADANAPAGVQSKITSAGRRDELGEILGLKQFLA